MGDLIITSDGQLAFLFDEGVVIVQGISLFFGAPTFTTTSDVVVCPK